ncbi:MAG: hypothetical protein R2771_02670 [Saprospiraceae bacterium]
MKSIIVLISFFLLGILFSGCEKDPYADAKENHRFFRCKVNGKEWHNEGYGFYGDDSAIQYFDRPYDTLHNGGFIVDMNYRPNENILESLNFAVSKNLIEGENLANYYQFGIFSPSFKLYKTDESYSNSLFIEEIDSMSRIITGTFEFRAITKDGQDTVLVTDGEFDWKPYWYIY